MNPEISANTRAKLMQVSTATLCTALFKRGLHRQFIQHVHPLQASGRNMGGPAFTLRWPQHPGPVPAHRRSRAHRLCRLARGR